MVQKNEEDEVHTSDKIGKFYQTRREGEWYTSYGQNGTMKQNDFLRMAKTTINNITFDNVTSQQWARVRDLTIDYFKLGADRKYRKPPGREETPRGVLKNISERLNGEWWAELGQDYLLACL